MRDRLSGRHRSPAVCLDQTEPVDGLNHQAAMSFQVNVGKGEAGSAVLRFRKKQRTWISEPHLDDLPADVLSGGLDAGGERPRKRLRQASWSPYTWFWWKTRSPSARPGAAGLHQEGLRAYCGPTRTSGNAGLRTQLVVSTHSSHVAHETPYCCLRYFRRLPAGMDKVNSRLLIVNLTARLGGDRNVAVRHALPTAQHADLFFADAVILVEGSAERMLLPNFIMRDYARVNQGYITMLEVGGSHAHRLRA